MNYYSVDRLSSANSLTHYGVPGMRWGIRRMLYNRRMVKLARKDARRAATYEHANAISKKLQTASKKNKQRLAEANKRHYTNQMSNNKKYIKAYNKEFARMSNDERARKRYRTARIILRR